MPTPQGTAPTAMTMNDAATTPLSARYRPFPAPTKAWTTCVFSPNPDTLAITPREAIMRNWIAGVMTVLGSILVIAGAAVVAVRAAAPRGEEPDHEAAPPARATARLVRAARRVNAADRLIAWGVLLLVLAAITNGAISFNLGVSATSR
jgi:hypothetical protein